jgi:glucose/arabinose dehydrogenase
LFSLLIVLLLAGGLAACSAGGATPLPAGSPTPGTAPATSTEALPPAASPVTATQTPAATAVAGQSQTPAAPTSEPVAATAAPAIPNLAAVQLDFQEMVSGLRFPVGAANAGDGSARLFVIEEQGRIRVVKNGALLDAPFLDIVGRVGSSASEQGLLGLAFRPDYKSSGFFYVYYTDRRGNTVVSRFSSQPGQDQADAGSEHVLLQVDQPAANHNGGQLAFGPDGYLYIGLGDGGGAGDTYGNGQNQGSLLAKILRIDVTGGDPYAVPRDNPFAGQSGVRPEVWAWGLRNPWRFSFDRLTGDLYIADVGQNNYEEVDFQPASSKGGENYGWSIMEGKHCFREQGCDQSGLTLPVAEYDHSQGCSITGGYVYRGLEFPTLAGIYFFGDYCSGRVWGLARDAGGAWQMAELASTGQQITAFAEDESGALYTLDADSGTLFKLVPQVATGD